MCEDVQNDDYTLWVNPYKMEDNHKNGDDGEESNGNRKNVDDGADDDKRKTTRRETPPALLISRKAIHNYDESIEGDGVGGPLTINTQT